MLIDNTTVYLWAAASDPDNNIYNSFDNYAKVGDYYLNTSSGYVFICTQDGVENQIWTRSLNEDEINALIAEIPQADWNQTDSGASDYIKNKPVLSFSTPTFSSATSSTQLSSTRNCQVSYTFPTSMTSVLTAQSLTATLQYADDSGFTTNIVTVNSDVQGCSGILSLTLSGRLQVQGIIPSGKYRKVTLSQTGGATVPTTLSSGQEVLL